MAPSPFRAALSYRFAAADDLIRFYGTRPRSSMQAVVILLDEKPVGVIGVAFERGHAKLFSDAAEALRPHMGRFEVLRAIQLAMRFVRTAGRAVYAVREEGSDLLCRLGFEHVIEDIYIWRAPTQVTQ